MAELIRELASQHGMNGPYLLISLRELEKFAEAIILECLDVCNIHSNVDGTAQKIAADIINKFDIKFDNKS